MLQEKLKLSNIYVIAQRSVLRFDNVRHNNEKLFFEINQPNNPHKLTCIVPIPKTLYNCPLKNIGFGSFNKNTIIKSQPFNNIHEIRFYYSTPQNQIFSDWISPEKFLFNCWSTKNFTYINGDIKEFTKYKVHYVGKATEQDLCKRLTGHSKLQDILSLENPLSYGELPTHEIVVLLFHVGEHIEIEAIYSKNAPAHSKQSPSYKNIALDIEKALIKAMSPKHNEVLFKNYPSKKDILNEHKYGLIYYHFADAITLEYENGKITGEFDNQPKDYIQILKHNPIRIGKLNE